MFGENPWISFTLSDPRFWSNAFVGVIARLLLCRETRWQKDRDLAYWPRRFQNSLYIASKNNSNQGVNSYNIG